MINNDHLKEVINIINEECERLYFVCNDPIHALGVVGIVENLTVVTYSDSPLVEALREGGVDIFLLDEHAEDTKTLHTTNNLISHDAVTRLITTDSDKKSIMVFKNSHVVEEQAKIMGTHLIAAPAKISRSIENKVTFYEALQGEDVPLIPGEVVTMGAKSDYETFARKYGRAFVLQASKGFGGNKTYFVGNAAEFNRVRNDYLKRRLRLTKFIPGATLTINACATKAGTIVKAPFYQLTGFEELTTNRLGACGNDFSIDNLPDTLIDEVIKCTKTIGDIIYSRGFIGIFGVDYVLGDNRFFFIECNPRLVTSISVFTGLETLAAETPLISFHLLENIDQTSSIGNNLAELFPKARTYQGAQLILHNLNADTKIVKLNMKCGVYMFAEGNLKFLRSGYGVDNLKSDDEYLIIPKAISTPVNSGIECARIFTKKQAMFDGILKDEMKRIIKSVYNKLM